MNHNGKSQIDSVLKKLDISNKYSRCLREDMMKREINSLFDKQKREKLSPIDSKYMNTTKKLASNCFRGYKSVINENRAILVREPYKDIKLRINYKPIQKEKDKSLSKSIMGLNRILKKRSRLSSIDRIDHTSVNNNTNNINNTMLTTGSIYFHNASLKKIIN